MSTARKLVGKNEEEVYYFFKMAIIRNITSIYCICVYIFRLPLVLNSRKQRSSFFKKLVWALFCKV